MSGSDTTDGAPLPARRRKWLVILALWGTFGAFYTAQSYTYRVSIGQAMSFWRLFPRDVSYIALWVALTPVILKLAERYRIDKTNWKTRAPLHLAIAIALAFVHRAAHEGLLVAMGLAQFRADRFFQTVLGTFDYGVFLYFIILLISHAVEFHDRFRREQIQASRLKADLAAAQLETLQTQLQPHFLFNTLNSISALVPSEPDVARRVIVRLSDFLRATLENRDSKSVTVRREMDLLASYLDIEKTRLGNRLTVEVALDREAERGSVPPLLLQPIVENAIRHGIAPRVGPGTLRIDVRRDGPWIEFVVRNSGGGSGNDAATVDAASGATSGLGMGLANTRERLDRLYGERSRMETREDRDGSFTVTLRIPFEEPAG